MLLVNAFAIAAGLILYVPRMEILFGARLLQGVCAGFFSSIAPLVMKELSPNEISGTLTSFNQIFIAFGVFFAFVFALIMTVTFNDPLGESTWWIIFGFPLGIVTLQSFLLICVFPYETPKYLFEHKDEKRGR